MVVAPETTVTDELADHLRQHQRWPLPKDVIRIQVGERFGLCSKCSRYGLYRQGDRIRCRYKDCGR